MAPGQVSPIIAKIDAPGQPFMHQCREFSAANRQILLGLMNIERGIRIAFDLKVRATLLSTLIMKNLYTNDIRAGRRKAHFKQPLIQVQRLSNSES